MDAIENFIDSIFEKIPYDKLSGMDIKMRWGIVAAGPILILVAAYFLFIGPMQSEMLTLKTELTKMNKDIKINQEVERNLPKIEAEIAKLEEDLSLIKMQLPDKREIPNLLDQISSLGTLSGLQFRTFRPKAEVDIDFYAEVPVELKMVGTFHSVVSFFDKVSKMARIVTTSNISIKKPNGKGLPPKYVIATCKATTYRFIESRVDHPKKPSVKGKKGR